MPLSVRSYGSFPSSGFVPCLLSSVQPANHKRISKMVAPMFGADRSILDSTDALWAKIQEALVKNNSPSIVPRYTAEGVASAVSNMTRQELLTKLISTCVGLTVSLSITYFGLKWLLKALDPTKEEKKQYEERAAKMMKRIGIKDIKLNEHELCIASNLIDPSTMTTTWEDIGGMEDEVEEIQESVILPFTCHKVLGDSLLLQPPKGVLLYGPPGCGKTMIAKAMAKATGARFINLSVSTLVDKWYGESQKRAEAVFSLAVKLQPTIIFIDEIDSFLRARTSSDHEATAMIKTQFMSFWDGLVTDAKCKVMIIGATNRPESVDAAILRRMPSMFYIGLPNASKRKHILELILQDEMTTEDVDLAALANQTEGFSGSDLRELCRNAAIRRLRDFAKKEMEREPSENEITEGKLRAITMSDLNSALYKINQSKLVNLVAAQQISLD